MPKKADTEVVRQAVQLSCRAPSVHNSQPWRWRWLADRQVLRLFTDTRRSVIHADRLGREALVSCGAALDHLRVAMLAAGWKSSIDRFPHAANPEHLASIEFGEYDEVTDADRLRASAILRRRTDRLPLGYPTCWSDLEPALLESVEPSGVTLDVLADDARPQLADASRLTEVRRSDDALYQLELAWWTSPFAFYEGVPSEAVASASERRRVMIARDFPARHCGQRRSEVAVDWSKILVLSTAKDTRQAALRCGEALSAVLLECTIAGLATCTLTHLIEIEESRGIVRDLIDGHRQPQVLIRAGGAPAMECPPAPTPRRPLDDVLQIER